MMGRLRIRADHQLMYFFVPLPKYFIPTRWVLYLLAWGMMAFGDVK
jgi:hypothetical protein